MLLAVALDVTSHHGVGRRSGLGYWWLSNCGGHGYSTIWAAGVLFCGVPRCLLPYRATTGAAPPAVPLRITPFRIVSAANDLAVVECTTAAQIGLQ